MPLSNQEGYEKKNIQQNWVMSITNVFLLIIIGLMSWLITNVIDMKISIAKINENIESIRITNTKDNDYLKDKMIEMKSRIDNIETKVDKHMQRDLR